jgi:crotonobetainyl-CoA:carnitine CoA-transferase CaiB-like acyl-CoA transferase
LTDAAPGGIGEDVMLSAHRVLDCTDGGASIAGQILADLGADVVLVEPRDGAASRRSGPFHADRRGPDRSLQFFATHRNKRSIEIDLETDAGRTELFGLLETADVLLESRPLDWLEERGLDPGRLIERQPRLIVVSITPFGRIGPKAHWAATDLTVTAACGQMILCGDEDRAPLTSTVPQAFLHAGAEAAVGALLALAARERGGRGQHVDVSAQTSMMMASQSMVLNHGWNDRDFQRIGGGLRIGDARVRFVYPCADGYVNFTFLFGQAIGPATARMFQWMYEEGFVDEATRDKDWIGFAARFLTGVEPASELRRVTEAIERFTLAHTKAELYRGAFERRVLIVPVSDLGDVAESRQLEARKFWADVDHPELGATLRYPGPIAKLSETPILYRRRPPRLDEHRVELLEEVTRLRRPVAPAEACREEPLRDAIGESPLAGLKVLDFTWAYAGPAVTRYLADYGATVVHVESQSKLDALRSGQPFKDGEFGIERSGGFVNLNAGKLGLGLNMAAPGARELALRLVDWADVVVENFSPRAMQGWGLDYATLRKRKPGIVMLSTSLNGQTGPEARLAGYGTMGAALAGFGFLTGWPDRPPSAPFLAYTDYVSPRFATAALLAALDHRRRHGEGQHVDCAQAECGIHFLGPAVLDYMANERIWRAEGNAHRDYAPSGVYPCAGDDRWLALAAPTPEAWRALCDVADAGWSEDVRFATQQARLANREALDHAIAAWTRKLLVDALERALQSVRVPVHRVSTSADLLGDPQLEAREHFVRLEHPICGRVPVESSRMRFSATPGQVTHPGPTLGQHSDHVLRDLLGLHDDEIEQLVVAGAIE